MKCWINSKYNPVNKEKLPDFGNTDYYDYGTVGTAFATMSAVRAVIKSQKEKDKGNTKMNKEVSE